MKKKIIPRGKWLLVKPDSPSSQENKHGLIIPANVEQEQKAQGIVEAIGDEVKKDIKKGDRIVYGAYAGETMKIREDEKEVEYKLLYDDDVIAHVK